MTELLMLATEMVELAFAALSVDQNDLVAELVDEIGDILERYYT